MPCQHKSVKEYEKGSKKTCLKCKKKCVSCVDCGRVILQNTADLYDGDRCSRCFDKFLYKNGKGIFKQGKVDLNDYGTYRNEIEWNESKHEYNKYKPSNKTTDTFIQRTVGAQADFVDEDYIYDDFCVPDYEPDYELDYEVEHNERFEYANNKRVMEEKYGYEFDEKEISDRFDSFEGMYEGMD